MQKNMIRLIGVDGTQLGMMDRSEAVKIAEEQELDLVEVAQGVCKIVNLDKYKYEQAKKAKKNNKNKGPELKEIRFSPNIADNDLETKARAVKKFLEKGHKVKVSVRFSGREIVHADSHILDEFMSKLDGLARIDKPAKLEGKTLSMFICKK